MVKINLGCGGNLLHGWENHDIDIDISNPLPFPDNHADYMFAEHCVEHITHPQALRFFMECHRVLRPEGVLRIAVPSIEYVYEYATEQYLQFLIKHGWSDGTKESAVRSIILNHEHQSAWTKKTLEIFLNVSGFKNVLPVDVGVSAHKELNGVEGHGKVIGEMNNAIETVVCEGTKL